VIVPFRLDVLPAHGSRGNDGDVEPDVLLAKIRTILRREGEVAVHGVQGHVAGLFRVGEHASHVVEGPSGGSGEGGRASSCSSIHVLLQSVIICVCILLRVAAIASP